MNYKVIADSLKQSFIIPKKMLLIIIGLISLNKSIQSQNICTNDTILSIADAPIADLFRTVKFGNDVYVFSSQQSNKYSTVSNTWTSIPQMPTPRVDFGVAEVNGVIYCLGGYTGSWSNKNEAFDIASKTWTTKKNLPNAIAGSFAVSLNNKIYVIGGTSGTTITYFYEYDPLTDSYISLATPSQNRMHTNLIAYNNKIYFVGGYFYNGSYNSTNLFDEYDLLTNKWTSKTSLPIKIFRSGVTIYDNKIYVFGGTQSTPSWTPMNAFFVFDFNTNQWTTMQSLPFSRTGIEAQTINNEVYLFGGNISSSTKTNLCYKYSCNPCNLAASITPVKSNVKAGDNALLTASAADGSATFEWQSNPDNFGWQNIPSNATYSGATTKNLTVNNVQLGNHNQPFRVIAAAGTCKDTSDVATIQLADTCLITVHDTLIINRTITGLSAPNNKNIIKVYPNPAKDHVVIHYGNFAMMSGYSVKITNTLGQELFTSPINQQTSSVNLSNWNSHSLYFIHIIDPQGKTVETRKILIE